MFPPTNQHLEEGDLIGQASPTEKGQPIDQGRPVNPAMDSISAHLLSLRRRFEPLTGTPALDAQVLLAHVLGRTRAWVMAHLDSQLSPVQKVELEGLARRLEAGEPLPYVLGHWEFYGLDFSLNPASLIPRPETELLVEAALAWLRQRPGSRRAVDVGTGSGCIAISLAVHCPGLSVIGTDLSPLALQAAHFNAQRHGVGHKVSFIQADLAAPLAGPVDLLCANLPYIPTGRLHTLDVSKGEPALALDGGLHGLSLIGRLLEQAPALLSDEGALLMEIDSSQGEAVRRMAQRAFPRAEIIVRRDLAGLTRLVEVQAAS